MPIPAISLKKEKEKTNSRFKKFSKCFYEQRYQPMKLKRRVTSKNYCCHLLQSCPHSNFEENITAMLRL